MTFQESTKKFRAKRTDIKNANWEYFSSFVEIANLRELAEHYGNWSQWTGAKDANKTDIYGFDILQAPSGLYFLVAWHEEEMRWALLHKGTWYNINAGLYKVVGTYYENKDILK